MLSVQNRFWQSLLQQLLVNIYTVIGGYIVICLPYACCMLCVLVSSYAVLFSVLGFNSFIVRNICINVFVTCFIAVDVDRFSATYFYSLLFLDVSYAYVNLHKCMLSTGLL